MGGGAPAVAVASPGSGPASLAASCDEQIEELIKERNELRRQKKWDEADQIKMLLQKTYAVELFDRSDGVGTTVWKRAGQKKNPPEMRISWSGRGHIPSTLDFKILATNFPLVIATVDTPHYRKRLQETMEHLSPRNEVSEEGVGFGLHFVDMLDLNKNKSLGQKRIVFESWRQVMLPKLVESFGETTDGFIVVVEDDVRLPSAIRPGHIRDICMAAFQENPDVNVLSLGHAWSPAKPSRRQRRRHRRQQESCNDEKEGIVESKQNTKGHGLLYHLEAGGGIHGATMLAIRTPDGIKSLLSALNGSKKKTHFDQFLFHSTLHNVGLALVDPPLAGWADVDETLTSVGRGQRKVGGGRFEHLPEVVTDVGDMSFQVIVRKLELELE